MQRVERLLLARSVSLVMAVRGSSGRMRMNYKKTLMSSVTWIRKKVKRRMRMRM